MKQPLIVIIDYDVGNVFSVKKALIRLGYLNIKVTREISLIKMAEAIILPGVGAFKECINNLNKYNLVNILNEMVIIESKPILGICIGMQLMADYSEEGGFCKGLGWIPGKVIKLNPPSELAVPHVGWNNLSILNKNKLFNKIDSSPHFYFDHSFQYLCDKKYILASCNYEIEITAAINYNNIYGTQFHPEKSQTNGLKIFRSFIKNLC